MRTVASKKLKQLRRLTRAQAVVSDLARLRNLVDSRNCHELDEKMKTLDDLVRSDATTSIFSSFYVGHLQQFSRKRAEAESRLTESSRVSHRENGKLKTFAEMEDRQKSLLSRLDEEDSLSVVLESWRGSHD